MSLNPCLKRPKAPMPWLSCTREIDLSMAGGDCDMRAATKPMPAGSCQCPGSGSEETQAAHAPIEVRTIQGPNRASICKLI